MQSHELNDCCTPMVNSCKQPREGVLFLNLPTLGTPVFRRVNSVRRGILFRLSIIVSSLQSLIVTFSSAIFGSDSLLLEGSAYCDTCRCGFETDASKPSIGAVVRVECTDRKTSEVTYTKESVTNSAGRYKILVERDCGEDYCDAVLVKSADPECSTPNAGRDRARVILTRNNGMNSNTRFASPMGFLKKTPLASCSKNPRRF